MLHLLMCEGNIINVPCSELRYAHRIISMFMYARIGWVDVYVRSACLFIYVFTGYATKVPSVMRVSA